jgi:branched-chain amino acid aminotransferase
MSSDQEMFKDGTAYVRGQYVPIAEASVSVLDWGFLRSDATYDVAHVWKGRFFRVQDHIDRFFQSAAALRLDIGLGQDEVLAIMNTCVVKSGFRDAFVEILVTRGRPQPGSRDPRTCTNQFIAFAIPFIWILPPERWQEGLNAAIGTRRRISADSVDSRVKNYHWLDFTVGLLEAYDKGSETVILLDDAGNVTEGPGFNVFGVKNGAVVTPAANVLEGITRRTVFELCQREGIHCEARKLAADELAGMEEVFLSSTAGGIMPVTVLDGHKLGDGAPGPVTTQLYRAYWGLKEDGWHGTPVTYL